MNRDFLNVIECVYRPDLADEEAWMGALLEALLPVIGEGFGVLGMFVDASDPTALHFGDVIGRGASEDFRANVRPNMAEFSPDVFSRALVGQPEIVSTMATVFGAEALGASPTFEKHYEAAGMRDSLLLLATDASGRGCAIAAGRAAIGSVPPDLREPLERVVIHATTALRLRMAGSKRPGRFLHARSDARGHRRRPSQSGHPRRGSRRRLLPAVHVVASPRRGLEHDRVARLAHESAPGRSLLDLRRRHLRALRRRILQRPSVRAAPLFEVTLPRGAVMAEDDAAAGSLREPGCEVRDDQRGLVVWIDWVGGFGDVLPRSHLATPSEIRAHTK
jgi:hypothetical protein